MLGRAWVVVLEAGVRAVRPVHAAQSGAVPFSRQCRFLSLSKCKNKSGPPSRVISDSNISEPPPISKEEVSDLEDFFREGGREIEPIDKGGETLPEPPIGILDSDFNISEEIAQEEEEEDGLDEVPYIPPTLKSLSLKGEEMNMREILSAPRGNDMITSDASLLATDSKLATDAIEIDPSLKPVLAAWARAVVPAPIDGPMPLHELANKSKKVKELVKLGVDMSKIVARHGDMERLLHTSWEGQIKPVIRFLVDHGVHSNTLGVQFTSNTSLLWTSIDDMQVRINYLEAKLFSPDQIRNILNRAPFWLTLPTKEIDNRLGFLQRTFAIKGSDVRQIAATFPGIVSSRKWSVFVATSRLMDSEFGFNEWERRELLFKKPQCYMRPLTLRRAFDLCHNQIGLTHTQLVRHATLLVNRINIIKPRYEFLKFLKRDNFNTEKPDYVSPDSLWEGTIQDFCEKVAKTTVEDYECFLKHSPLT